jgi:hypothetical protein
MEVPSPAVTRDDSSVSAMIGGTLDFRALSVLRQAADPDTLDAGVRHLAAQGLTVSDVASTLSVACNDVARVLESNSLAEA